METMETIKIKETMETIKINRFTEKMNDLLNPVCYAVVYTTNYDILAIFRYEQIAEDFIRGSEGLKIVRLEPENKNN